MFKLQGKDIGQYLENIELKLVRTYKGEILRTMTGRVPSFPVSFIVVGFEVSFLAPREEIKVIEQLFLSHDIVEVAFNYKETALKGKFSCTENTVTEVLDKGERHKRLNISLVSDGTDIKNADGGYFKIKKGATTLKDDCVFGKVYRLSQPASFKGYALPDNKILVLGDVELD